MGLPCSSAEGRVGVPGAASRGRASLGNREAVGSRGGQCAQNSLDPRPAAALERLPRKCPWMAPLSVPPPLKGPSSAPQG